ncbi:MAG: hypothetical protein KC591_09875, partial [Gemmatimonadetes bacterium]|nr:hypothetical protein [Gemmatimonadota bacterium]
MIVARALRTALVVASTSLAALGATGCGEPAPEPPRRVLVFGIDGGDWDRAIPLMRQGKMPTLERLMR